MPLTRPTYYVETDPAAEPITVAISSGDQLRAELEQRRLNLPDKLPFHTSVLWIWAALVRLGLEDRRAGEFISDPPEWQPVKDAAGQQVVEDVDPTAAG